jgi:multiple sugar transport system permease protein
MVVTERPAAVPTTGAAARRRRPWRAWLSGPTPAFWLFVAPFLAGLVIFTFVPIGWSLYLSFFEARNTVTPTEFVGFANYLRMLRNPAFQDSMLTFTVFTLFIVPVTFVFSLGLALLVWRIRFMRAFFRSVFFLPTAVSYVAASLIWKLSIFNGVRFGLANQILDIFDVDDIAWLSTIDPPYYWVPLVSVRLWLQAGFFMILFLAGLQRIPSELYEAAYVDGARPGWQTLRFITLPQLRATSVAVLLLIVIHAYQAFDEFYNLMPNAGNVPYARPPLVYLYHTALGDAQNFGDGTAGALLLTALIMVVTLLQGRLFGFGKAD